MKKKKLTAKTADPFILYQDSVQDVDSGVDFLRLVFRTNFGRLPDSLREDFCGTALLCCRWTSLNRRNTAVGIDMDDDTLDWGRRNNLSALRDPNRVRLIQGDVLRVRPPKVDVAAAFNFSYCVFKDRKVLTNYFRKVRQGLNSEGCFVLDLYGGPEAIQEMEEERKEDGFTYVWDQERYNPITAEILCHIHFRFRDGSALRKAYTYDWRLWTIPELKEALVDAGFSKVDVYWEGTDKNGEGNDIYRKTERGTADICWISYIAAIK